MKHLFKLIRNSLPVIALFAVAIPTLAQDTDIGQALDPNLVYGGGVLLIVIGLLGLVWLIAHYTDSIRDSVNVEVMDSAMAELRGLASELADKYADHAKTTNTQVDDIASAIIKAIVASQPGIDQTPDATEELPSV